MRSKRDAVAGRCRRLESSLGVQQRALAAAESQRDETASCLREMEQRVADLERKVVNYFLMSAAQTGTVYKNCFYCVGSHS